MLTCQGLSQSRGIGKAPTQAPTTVQATVICRQVSHTDIALEPETEQGQLVCSIQRHKIKHMKHMTGGQGAGEKKRSRFLGSPMPTEHSYPGLDVGAEDTETPQCGQRGQQHSEGECLQGESETCEMLRGSQWSFSDANVLHRYSKDTTATFRSE